MKREFSIVEIMLDGVSGQVDGVVTTNPWTGEVEEINCRWHDFFDDATDAPAILNESQRQDAQQLVLRALELDSELTESHDRLVASAATLSLATSTELSPAQKILAEYLENVRPAKADNDSSSDGELPVRRFG